MSRARWIAVCALVAAAPAARAEPEPGAASAPSARAPAAPRRFYIRVGGARVQPASSSRELELADVTGPASLAVHDGPIPGSGAAFDAATVPALIVGYVLPTAGRRWSLETVLGLPFTVRFRATGTLATMSIAPTALGIPTGVGPLGPELGEATAAPPMLTAVYQLTDGGVVRPYVGAGAAVLIALDAKVTNPILTAVRRPEMSIAPAPGVVGQVGVDLRVWRGVYARLDVKFIAGMLARAEVKHVEVQTPGLPLFDTVEVGTAKMSVWLNPFVFQAGVGTDF